MRNDMGIGEHERIVLSYTVNIIKNKRAVAESDQGRQRQGNADNRISGHTWIDNGFVVNYLKALTFAKIFYLSRKRSVLVYSFGALGLDNKKIRRVIIEPCKYL